MLIIYKATSCILLNGEDNFGLSVYIMHSLNLIQAASGSFYPVNDIVLDGFERFIVFY